MKKNAEFEMCADFLAEMIIKYGNEVDLPKTAVGVNACERERNDCSFKPQRINTLDRATEVMLFSCWDTTNNIGCC